MSNDSVIILVLFLNIIGFCNHFAIDFVPFVVEFIAFAIEFGPFATEFVSFAVESRI